MPTEPTTSWRYIQFGLLVTGKAEEACLPDLFRPLMAKGGCTFRVLRRIGQLTPITSAKHKMKLQVGGKQLPSRDEEIGLAARAFLQPQRDRYLLLIDDLEGSRALQFEAVYQRYRLLLDTMLGPLKVRSSVHFLVNMLEAYFFADAAAINAVAGTGLVDWAEDIETIPHPKNLLKQHFRGYRETEHGKQILAHLHVDHVLSRPEACAALRTMFAWCERALAHPFGDAYRLADGRLHPATRAQVDQLLLL